MANETSLKKEIEELRNHIDNLEHRTNAIEENIGIKEQPPEIQNTQPKEPEEVENPEEEKAPKRKYTTFEQDIGTKWFGKVGTLALVMGIAYFIKYAFDNNWISHTTRIILGTLTGIIIIIAGQLARTNKPYARWCDTLTGGGFAITYFCIYAAYHYGKYRTATGISLTQDIILLSIVALAAIITSLRNDSQVMAAESFLLGYTTSHLSLSFETLTLIYGLLLTIGLVVTVTKKGWTTIGILGIMSTYWLHIKWYADNRNDFTTSSIFLISYFLLYTAQTLMINKDSKKSPIKIMANLNSILFFAIFFMSISKHYPAYKSLFTFLLSLASAAIYFISSSLNKESIKNTYICLSFFYLTFAIPIQFDNYWVSILWSIEIISLIIAGTCSGKPQIIKSANLLAVLTTLRLVLYDTLALESYNPTDILKSERLIAYISVISAYYIISGYLWLAEKKTGSTTQKEIYSWTGSALAVIIIFVEMKTYWISVGWTLLAMCLLIIGLIAQRKELRTQGILILLLTIMKVFLHDTTELKPIYRTISLMVLGIILISVSFLYTRYKEKIKDII